MAGMSEGSQSLTAGASNRLNGPTAALNPPTTSASSGGAPTDPQASPPRSSALYTPTFPPAHDDFPAANDPLEAIVNRPRNPPPEAYNASRTVVTLPLQWAIGVIGVDQFREEETINRRILRSSSEVRQRGVAAGVPVDVLAWLVGAPATETVELSAEVFKGENKDGNTDDSQGVA
ncbi:hypothetical protein BU26DRAFT_510484 [Trematosphaeria pertusa]|uniref:Uncharacterized protein n=1 Tax=Trematosphaeria pertusa TaxID=390896 RepID=A0A6A6HWS1_9PLEO|nr:uncharacterized protein BU26DRAFT_510484 [Trematosphaeria pertusa]KAF2242655.1 hypothetical protein BU26DRAFT_510484 [Trematosphaeria pertusa]